MKEPDQPDIALATLLGRLQKGDTAAREELISHFCGQLQRHAHNMLQGFPSLKRWVQTDDVFQSGMIRLLRALEEVQPESPKHFLRLATMQIRRELIDLARHFYGPQGQGVLHRTNSERTSSQPATTPIYEQGNVTTEPSRLAAWAEFHEHIEELPEEERLVFDLLWYQEMSQPEAAAFLGMPERTLKRRWQSARLHLHEKLQGKLIDW